MEYILFDDQQRQQLFPFTLTRPVCELRVGILTIFEKWKMRLTKTPYYHTEAYLQQKYKPFGGNASNFIYINGAIMPNQIMVNTINSLPENSTLVKDEIIIAHRSSSNHFNVNNQLENIIVYPHEVNYLSQPWEIFGKNGEQIVADFELVTGNQTSEIPSQTNTIIGNGKVFIAQGAVVECAVLNTTNGPIYIGKNAEIMEGSLVRGPFALGEGATIKMGAKIYGDTTIGPFCKVGGEVSNSVILGYANKGHDGFLGNSVIGEWCNLGADTNNSNLKNNYGIVKIWDMATQQYKNTNLTFCGLLMGDHSKSGINTMFNTGTVVGAYANIFDGGFPPKFVPSFSWGGGDGAPIFEKEKAIEVAQRVYARRNLVFETHDVAILNYLHPNKAI
jgi:UDP-N-acetylglucosamine diphosphorylase/glucosamine-1-phosphate N-acetyltransferase